MDPAKFKERIDLIYRDLDQYSYYELLNLSAEATTEEIQQAFHRMALSMHPDRHFMNPDQELKQRLGAIYKRVAEGYRVLCGEQTRPEYDRQLAEGEMRLVRTERKRSGMEHPEDSIDNHQARKFFVIGLKAERDGDLQTARLNYKFALDLAEDHPTIVKRMEWVDSLLADGKRGKKKKRQP
jgi:DnaJ-class molecular chaperone